MRKYEINIQRVKTETDRKEQKKFLVFRVKKYAWCLKLQGHNTKNGISKIKFRNTDVSWYQNHIISNS